MMRELNPGEAQRLMETGVPLVDVREADEWDAGHAPGAVHAPLTSLDPAALPGGRPVLAICRTGRRSALAQHHLSALGIETINVAGGMVAWAERGLPVVTDPGVPGRVL